MRGGRFAFPAVASGLSSHKRKQEIVRLYPDSIYAAKIRAEWAAKSRRKRARRKEAPFVHPPGCLCRDCLWPETVTAYEPRIARMA